MMNSLTVKIAKSSVAGAALLLAACSQPPAPVVDGYAKPDASFAASQAQMQANYQKYGSFTDRVSNENTTRVSKGAAGVQTAALDKPLLPPSSVAMKEENLAPNLASIQPAEGQVPKPEKPMLIKPVRGRTLTTTADLQDVKKPLVDAAVQPASGKDIHYTVQAGDGVYPLARRYKVTPQEIFAANKLPHDAVLHTGQEIVIPQPGGQTAAAATPVIAHLESGMDSNESKLQARLDSNMKAAKTVTPDAPAYVQHTVQPGETVSKISRAYHASVIDIMAANDMQTPQQLKSGMVVKVPVNGSAAHVATAQATGKPRQVAQLVPSTLPTNWLPADPTGLILPNAQNSNLSPPPPIDNSSDDENSANPDGTVGPENNGDDNDDDNAQQSDKPVSAADHAKGEKLRGHVDAIAARSNGLAWPVRGTVIRKFGEQGNGVMQSGINISVPANTPVLATEQGTVIYAGNGLRSYGNIVLLRHPDGMVSAYAHNNQLLVAKGDTVKKGQVIAMSGATGNVDKPQLHFEIRQAARAVDPMRMLAAR